MIPGYLNDIFEKIDLYFDHLYWDYLMKPSVALKRNKNAIKIAVRARRAANVRVFGSVLYESDTDGSDLDLLVDTLPGATLFDLGGLQVDPEEMLGVPVDLLTPKELPAQFRQKILDEARHL